MTFRHMNQTEECNRPQCWCNRPTEQTTNLEGPAMGTTLPTMVPIRSIPIGGTFQYLPRNETFRVIERDDETTTYKSEDVQNPSRIVTRSGWKVWDLTTTTNQEG